MKRLTLIPLPLICVALCLSACSDKEQRDPLDPVTSPTGNLIVLMNVTGDVDPSSVGCGVMLDGHYCSRLNSGGCVTLNVAPGRHTVALVQIPKGCTATDGASKTVRVVRGQSSEVSFSLDCGDVPDWRRRT